MLHLKGGSRARHVLIDDTSWSTESNHKIELMIEVMMYNQFRNRERSKLYSMSDTNAVCLFSSVERTSAHFGFGLKKAKIVSFWERTQVHGYAHLMCLRTFGHRSSTPTYAKYKAEILVVKCVELRSGRRLSSRITMP